MLWMNVAMQKNRPLIQYSVIFSLVCLLGTSHESQARMYKWVDADGNTHYTQQLPPEGAITEDIKLPASVNLDNKEAVKAFEDQQNKKQESSETKQKDEIDPNRQAEHTALKKENCRKAKAKLENVQNTGRIRATLFVPQKKSGNEESQRPRQTSRNGVFDYCLIKERPAIWITNNLQLHL